MRELKATKINAADFAPFGTFFSMTEPEGYPLQGEIHKFYPDRISGTCMGSIGFSPIAVHKDERIVKAAEYHTCSTGFCRHTCSGTYQSIHSSKRNYGEDQCCYLAFMSSSFKQ